MLCLPKFSLNKQIPCMKAGRGFWRKEKEGKHDTPETLGKPHRWHLCGLQSPPTPSLIPLMSDIHWPEKPSELSTARGGGGSEGVNRFAIVLIECY